MGRKASPRLPHTMTIEREQAFAPLVSTLNETFITSADLSKRWGLNTMTLSNQRKRSNTPEFIVLPSGAIRYRVSSVVAAELAGTFGALTLDRVLLAVASCASVSTIDRQKMQMHLRNALAEHVTDDRAAKKLAAA